MRAQEILIDAIKRQPEPVVREILLYLKFLEHHRAQEEWADVLPSREAEQEKLDILDGNEPAPRRSRARGHGDGRQYPSGRRSHG